MPLLMTDAVKNAQADALAALIAYLSVHTATPGTTGAAEAGGGSPAYARKAVTFNTAGAVGPLGSAVQPATIGVAWSNQCVFDLPAGTYPYWGAWTAVTAGTFRIGNNFAVSRILSTQDVLPFAIGVGPAAGA